MSAPTPTSPTLADLQYNAYNPGGALNTVTVVLPVSIASVLDSTVLKENVVLNFVGFTGTVDTSDVLNTAESVRVVPAVPGPNSFAANVSDTVTTTENTSVTPPA